MAGIPDKNIIQSLVTNLMEEVTCAECCKVYKDPSSGPCGHQLCYLCWTKRRTCPFCGLSVNRKNVKLNLTVKTLTDAFQVLYDTIEKNCDIKLDEPEFETSPVLRQENYSINKNNQLIDETQKNKELSSNNFKIHSNTKKINMNCTKNQDACDKIKSLPEDNNFNIHKENIISPMNIEQNSIDDEMHTIKKPRRSSRTKEKINVSNSATKKKIGYRNISKNSNSEADKVSRNIKHSWNNVKKIQEAFCKRKQNVNKLNVSIEKCKKAQKSNNRPTLELSINTNAEKVIQGDKLGVEEQSMSVSNTTQTLSTTYTEKTASQPISDYNLKDNMELSEKEQINLSKSETTKTNDTNESITRLSWDANFKDSASKTKENVTNSIISGTRNKVPFFKKGLLHPKSEQFILDACDENSNQDDNVNTVDVLIKIMDTQAKILFNPKSKKFTMIEKMDRATQTYFEPQQMVETSTLPSHNFHAQNMKINENKNNKLKQNKTSVPLKQNDTFSQTSPTSHKMDEINNTPDNNKTRLYQNIQICDHKNKRSVRVQNKNQRKENVKGCSNISLSTKQNTFSVETLPTHIQIPETVDNQLTNTEFENNNDFVTNNIENRKSISELNSIPISSIRSIEVEEVDSNDQNVFNNEIIKDGNAKYVEHNLSSEVIMPTILSTKKNTSKRRREIYNNDHEQIPEKKIKVFTMQDSNDTLSNYDVLMNQVFANIDADIGNVQNTQNTEDKIDDIESINSENCVVNKISNPMEVINSKNIHDKDSEYFFSMTHKDHNILGSNNYIPASILENAEEIHTPIQNIDDSDDCASIVEDTPQKTPFKMKEKEVCNQSKRSNTGDITVSKTNSMINTVIEKVDKNQTLETPLNKSCFDNQITYKSTPIARKSLRFGNLNKDNQDNNETFYPTVESIVKNTQEREFMEKAFENSPEAVLKLQAVRRYDDLINKKMCITSSRLNSDELKKLKLLCKQRNLMYTENYTDDVTHLVVCVDDDMRSQRSVKYMRALAAGKWIISIGWVLRCLNERKMVDERQFEALDPTGVPGPKRSRITKKKLFNGITFFCMPPFSVLDKDTFKSLLQDAGGIVVDDVQKVTVNDDTEVPYILLTEPENTEDDKFTFLAMQLQVVPVNYEWALNCLGSYCLEPIQSSLLCPSSILPKATSKWPECIFASDI